MKELEIRTSILEDSSFITRHIWNYSIDCNKYSSTTASLLFLVQVYWNCSNLISMDKMIAFNDLWSFNLCPQFLGRCALIQSCFIHAGFCPFILLLHRYNIQYWKFASLIRTEALVPNLRNKVTKWLFDECFSIFWTERQCLRTCEMFLFKTYNVTVQGIILKKKLWTKPPARK